MLTVNQQLGNINRIYTPIPLYGFAVAAYAGNLEFEVVGYAGKYGENRYLFYFCLNTLVQVALCIYVQEVGVLPAVYIIYRESPAALPAAVLMLVAIWCVHGREVEPVISEQAVCIECAVFGHNAQADEVVIGRQCNSIT